MIDLLDEDDSTTGSPRALIDQPGPQSLIVADWAAESVQGRQRLCNEDSWRQLGPVFVVADGMGGLAAGDEASRTATAAMVTEWMATETADPASIVREVNRQVRALACDEGESGCTLSALRIAHDQATVVHVGDSRIYRIRGSHTELLTRDHNLRSELLAAGIIPDKSRQLGPLRALTSYLGKPDHDLQIDVRSVSLRRGDRLVMCSDGVSHDMAPDEFAKRVRGATARVAVEQLTSMHGTDDATAVVIDIDIDAER